MSALKQCDVISVKKLEGDGNLKAYVDIRVGGALIIRGCSVMDGKKGIFASMPRRANRLGQWMDVVFAADDDLRSHYSEQILKAYEETGK